MEAQKHPGCVHWLRHIRRSELIPVPGQDELRNPIRWAIEYWLPLLPVELVLYYLIAEQSARR